METLIGLEKARGLGAPRTAEERVAAHYGIDVNEARRWLAIHPESELLPERGAGFARVTAAGRPSYLGQLAEVAVGFTLKITNAPLEAVLWNANFAERTFDYDPLADSGWLGIDEVWEYPSDPLGCTTLRIWALDADNNILFDVYNLGPIEDGKDYTYDCSTGVLYEAIPALSLWPLAIIGGVVVGVLGIGVVMASAMAKG